MVMIIWTEFRASDFDSAGDRIPAIRKFTDAHPFTQFCIEMNDSKAG